MPQGKPKSERTQHSRDELHTTWRLQAHARSDSSDCSVAQEAKRDETTVTVRNTKELEQVCLFLHSGGPAAVTHNFMRDCCVCLCKQ
jgi:hypothetical protein